MKRAALVATLAVALGACAAPSSFDGLTGGTKLDDSLGAPRPMSPISVSMVATSRPRLKWVLSGSLTGAVVEMSKSREFLPDATKTFTASGSELVVPEDLEAGIWFWRLSGTAGNARGTTKSATWEVLVRGPAKFGSSEAPSGSVVDLDGDGNADLVAVGDSPYYDEKGKVVGYDVVSFEVRSRANAELAVIETTGNMMSDYEAGERPVPVALAAGVDFDGDGFGDLAFATQVWMGPGAVAPAGATFPGSVKGLDYTRFNDLMLGYEPGVDPTVSAAGDVDGDGFGDLLVGGNWDAMLTRGSPAGPKSSAYLFPAREYRPVLEGRAVLGAFDADGDGISDIAVAQARVDLDAKPAGASVATANALGAGKHFATTQRSTDTQEIAPDTMGMGNEGAPDLRKAVQLTSGFTKAIDHTHVISVSRAPNDGATAKKMATGDFNGDGLADIATLLFDSTSARVCIYYGSRESFLVDGGCLEGLDGTTMALDGLTTADLEGDGQDELLVAGSSKVRAVHFPGQGDGAAPRIEVVAEIRGITSITTIWPGRPAPARWAVADGSTITVYEGTSIKQTIVRPEFITRWGRAMR